MRNCTRARFIRSMQHWQKLSLHSRAARTTTAAGSASTRSCTTSARSKEQGLPQRVAPSDRVSGAHDVLSPAAETPYPRSTKAPWRRQACRPASTETMRRATRHCDPRSHQTSSIPGPASGETHGSRCAHRRESHRATRPRFPPAAWHTSQSALPDTPRDNKVDAAGAPLPTRQNRLQNRARRPYQTWGL